MPLRRSVTALDRVAQRAEACRHLGLQADLPTLLAFGGSQGARRINDAVEGAIGALISAGAQVLHITGPGSGPPALQPEGPIPGYIRMGYCDRMDLAYAASDLVLCRAGMTTVAELTAVGLPAAYVPLPIGNGEQRLNAEPVVAAGGGVLVRDVNCTPAWVLATLLPLLGDTGRLSAMGHAAARLGRPDADERLADLVLQAVGRAGER
jgi:UDP-N-acetylglucosamine--N-acetylmuramyl-(pentapeptide) pyrophosphoryl-undecaprenol N-acetylglucosamine transferase